jgi:nucleoside 2-deoxyribosyltransferase
MAHIYVAAPWICKADAQNFATQLEQAGHDITERWWEHREVASYPGRSLDDLAELRKQAERDLAGIDDADLVIVLQLTKSEGKAAETGYALAQEKPILVVSPNGEYGNLFHTMEGVTMVRTTKEALAYVNRT